MISKISYNKKLISISALIIKMWSDAIEKILEA